MLRKSSKKRFRNNFTKVPKSQATLNLIYESYCRIRHAIHPNTLKLMEYQKVRPRKNITEIFVVSIRRKLL